MNDPVDPMTTATPAPDPAGQKSPIDLLEEILKEQSTKAAVPPAASTPEPVVPPGPPQPPQPSIEEIQALQVKQHAEDVAAAQAKLQEIHQEVNSVSNQARVSNDQAVEKAATDKHDAQDGYEIKQLAHIKV